MSLIGRYRVEVWTSFLHVINEPRWWSMKKLVDWHFYNLRQWSCGDWKLIMNKLVINYYTLMNIISCARRRKTRDVITNELFERVSQSLKVKRYGTWHLMILMLLERQITRHFQNHIGIAHPVFVHWSAYSSIFKIHRLFFYAILKWGSTFWFHRNPSVIAAFCSIFNNHVREWVSIKMLRAISAC